MQNNLFFLHLSSETDPSVGPISILKKSEENEVEARADLDGKIINYVTFIPIKKYSQTSYVNINIGRNVTCLKHLEAQLLFKKFRESLFYLFIFYIYIYIYICIYVYMYIYIYIYINFQHYNL